MCDDETYLSAILDAAVDAIIVSDASGLIVRTNPAADRMFQYDPSELIDQNVSVLMPMSIAELHDTFMDHHIGTGEKRIIGIGRDLEGQRKDGSVFPLNLSVGSAKIDAKRMFIGILHDLTQRNSIQAALARSQRLDAIGQMTGGIAHDFNNLLTVVIGNLELLAMRGADPRQMTLIKDALDAAEMGADLTSRLMVFGGKGNLNPIRSDLSSICEKTLSILQDTLGPRYQVTAEYQTPLDPVMIDPIQLQSALMNLALNARDAMGETGQLLISAANVSIDDAYLAQEIDVIPGDYVRLSVNDTGSGMSPEVEKRAFEPFFTTKAGTGTGLGLAMVYGFVRQSGGHITIYSEPGVGTSFGLYFPALKDSEAADDPSEGIGKKRGLVDLGHGETVLIVEDNPRVRKVSVQRVLDLGFNVVEATNGDEAYAMLKSGLHVGIVFSDLVMPGALNGFDLAARIKAEFPKIKVLLTSGYASDLLTDRMAHDIEYSILHKPFRQSDLASRLQALLAEDSDA